MDPATAQRLYPKGSWVLVGPNMTGPSRDVFWTSKAWGAFIVQPSPPKNPREQPRWFRKYRGFTYVMQHFSASEFISLGLVLNLLWGVFVLTKPFSLARCLDLMERHSHKWGPSAHLCVALERDLLSPEKCIEDAQNAAAQFVAKFSPNQDLSTVNLIDLPHILFAIQPLHLDFVGRECFRVKVATDYLNQFITEARQQSVIT